MSDFPSSMTQLCGGLGVLLRLTLNKPNDGVIIASTARAHLWGRAGLTVAPEAATVNKSSNKAVGQNEFDCRWYSV